MERKECGLECRVAAPEHLIRVPFIRAAVGVVQEACDAVDLTAQQTSLQTIADTMSSSATQSLNSTKELSAASTHTERVAASALAAAALAAMLM